MDTEEKSTSISASSAVQYITIRSRIINGILHHQNKGAVDWGWQSLLAYGCQTLVVVLDPKNVQTLQTLHKHRHPVTKVKWAKENYYHDLSNPYYPKLASVDSSGTIIAWDVIYSKVVSTFTDGSNKSVADMEWLSQWSSYHEFLAVLHSPYSFSIWNTTNGTKIWKKTYTESLLSFSFDPFEPSNIAFLAQDSILFIDDFSLNKVPSSNGRKFYISNPSSMSGSVTNLVNVGTNSSSADDKTWSRERLRRRVRFLIKAADTKSSSKPDENTHQNECLQLCYHRSCRHHLLLLYPKEILIVDLEINQAIGIVTLERNGSPFSQVFSCQQRDALYCLHDNGSVSLRVRRKLNVPPAAASSFSPVDSSSGNFGDVQNDFLEVSYDLKCQSDSLRLTKHTRLMGIAICPVSEYKTTLLLSDGRILFFEVIAITKTDCPWDSDCSTSKDNPQHHSKVDSSNSQNPLPPRSPSLSICDFFPPSTFQEETRPSATGDVTQASSSPQLKFLLTGLWTGLAPPPYVVRMCPPLTTKNWTVYEPLLAVGNTQGSIQVVCMGSGVIKRELSIHSCPVRGVEWVSLHGFISFAYPNLSSSSGFVRNELILTDLVTGKSTVLRGEKEESPIEMVRVSCYKNYFVVVFKEEPFEIWDLRKQTILRTMPKKFPIVTALEWIPIKASKNKTTDSMKSSSSTHSLDAALMESGVDSKERSLGKEQMVFCDTNGQLYNFSIEGTSIKDGAKLPAQSSMGNITCIAWRTDQIVMGDVDGTLNMWDLKNKLSKVVHTHRGWIKKIRFAPGRGNLKLIVLYNDGVEIWDLRESEVVSSIKCPQDIPKIYDVDWAASDTPVLATGDGCIYLSDLNLKHMTSPSYRYHFQDPVFYPHLSTSEAALNLRAFLQNQSWRSTYSMYFSEDDGIKSDDLVALQNYIDSIDSDVREFLPHCPFGSADRCLITARLFGDESELHFWTVALHYIRREKMNGLNQVNKNIGEDISPNDISSNHHRTSPPPLILSSTSPSSLNIPPLDSGYDEICDSRIFQRRQLDRVALHDSKRATYDQTKNCAEMLILLRQTDRAVQLLLETDTETDNYYVDCLRACLVASVRSSGAAQSTIKLVATNLIASGRISEGVQLLCLIDKAADACRYLQSYNHWNRAAWLAKAALGPVECQEVMKRWVDHLCSVLMNQKQKAVLILLSIGQFQKVVEVLMSMKCVERATMFIHACQEHGMLLKDDSNSSLIEGVFLEYARYMFSLGNTQAAYHYCTLVGPLGEQLRKEMEILAEDEAV